MRLDLDFDFDDFRRLARKRAAERPAAPKESEPLIQPRPLDRRVRQLAEQAQQNRFPEIPRRHYERNLASEVAIDRELGERHVRSRHHLPLTLTNIRLYPQEKHLLGKIGRFRVIALKDAAQTVYGGNERARAAERMEVVTLTAHGERLARLTNVFVPGQKLYHGLVSRARSNTTRKSIAPIRRTRNGSRRRAATLNSRPRSTRRSMPLAQPERDLDEIKQQVARDQQLPFIENQIQIPEARIEYYLARKGDQDMDQGSQSGHSDIQVLTAAYHPGHLRSKAQAGFRLYASASDRATLTGKVEDEHHLLDQILDL